MLLDLVFSDGDYSSLNNFIPTFVIQVDEANPYLKIFMVVQMS